MQGFSATGQTRIPTAAPSPTLTFDSTTGNPNAGSVDVTLPFSNYDQWYTVTSNVAAHGRPQGKTIHAKVRLDDVGWRNDHDPRWLHPALRPEQRIPLRGHSGNGPHRGHLDRSDVNANAPGGSVTTGYDPTQIIQVGVQIGTGSKPDGGVFGAEISPKLHIDSIIVQ